MSTQLPDILQFSIAASHEAVPVTDEQRQEFDCRLQRHSQKPEEGVAWDALKESA